MLKPYRLYRFICSTCGIYERKIEAHLKVTLSCPGCLSKKWVTIEQSVPGMTVEALPSFTMPHTRQDPGRHWTAKQNYQSSANGKSTGRPKKKHHGANKTRAGEATHGH